MKDKLIEKLYECSKVPYQKFFKRNKPWEVDKATLLHYPEGTLGFGLGKFLNENHFDMQPKLEDHDVIHVLTNTGISVPDEIGMQYYLLGNGKRSLYLFLVIFSGTPFYLKQIRYFIEQYKRGKKAHSFYYLDFSNILLVPVKTIQHIFNI